MQFLEDLFVPFVACGRTVPSRILMAPVNTGFAVKGAPTDDLVRFHEARSGPEIGVSMVGNVAVSSKGGTNSSTALLDKSSDLDQYCRLAAAIKSRGSLAGIQLANTPELSPGRKWVARNRDDERNRLSRIVSSLTEGYLESCLSDFVTATQLAVTAGFEVVQIHAAHGYLLSLLLNPLTNVRRDRFQFPGAWLRPFLIELLEACAGCILSARLSVMSGLTSSPSDEISAAKLVSQAMEQVGVHFIDYSAGFYTVDRRLIYPGTEKGMLPLRSYVVEIAKHLNCICGVSGNVQDLRLLPPLPGNFVISIGRGLIADPALVRKARADEYSTVMQCKRTGRCHYFSRGNRTIECGVNASIAKQVNA